MAEERFSEDLDDICSGCGDVVDTGISGDRYCKDCEIQQAEEEQYNRRICSDCKWTINGYFFDQNRSLYTIIIDSFTCSIIYHEHLT